MRNESIIKTLNRRTLRRQRRIAKKVFLRFLSNITVEIIQCVYCAKKLENKSLTVDHVVPLSKGGSNDLTNLVPCCEKCNGRKKDKIWKLRHEGIVLSNSTY